ncbi:hypothetical protein [Polluticaenibacter yanchengensis]|uniref:Uncharacterized protein n=1 Tax=Polluticaenibacter yanchengensis TaxID=3014562 RepID=A0ABT4UJK2_9BACT|nr:hypothetical protein [Chitinophagaceae bacterium LY-5]
MMNLPIQIPNPCHENWSGMMAQQNGRYCGACEKIVVDFTDWEPDDILQYLKNNSKTCGRLKVEQLKKPGVVTEENNWLLFIGRLPFSRLARLAIYTFTVFQLVACNNHTSGEVVPVVKVDSTINQPGTIDSMNVVLGEPVIPVVPLPPIECGTEIMGMMIAPPRPEYITGELAIEPEPIIDSSQLVNKPDSIIVVPRLDTLVPTDITR